MPPKDMSQADIERLITARVNAALTADRAARNATGGASRSKRNAGGQGGAPPARECTFTGFM
ncbi:hypothetical protein Tco_1270860, partial [Tanacetum coccineum]